MSGFLDTPPITPAAQAVFDEDVDELGFVMNSSRLWAYQPATLEGLFALIRTATADGRPSLRRRGILLLACVSTLGDAYCSIAWATKLTQMPAAGLDGAAVAAVLRGDDSGLTPGEQAMARWARQVVRDPNATTAGDVQALRDNGFTDAEIFEMTVFVALRQAFSTVNDALGARPDAAFREIAPADALATVTYGRPLDA